MNEAFALAANRISDQPPYPPWAERWAKEWDEISLPTTMDLHLPDTWSFASWEDLIQQELDLEGSNMPSKIQKANQQIAKHLFDVVNEQYETPSSRATALSEITWFATPRASMRGHRVRDIRSLGNLGWVRAAV